MSESDPFSVVPHGLGEALKAKGFTALTTVQEAVLKAAQPGRDLRITSQTGSGKTVAIGLAVAGDIVEATADKAVGRTGPATPRVLLVAPTRELAAQLAVELTWLYAPLGARIGVVTGGTSVGGDRAIFSRKPHVLVGTPGRLVDHLTRGALSLEQTSTVVLDEADEMLDMGFREDLEAILDRTPEDRSTHLVSATFARQVLALAGRYQRDAYTVHGAQLGKANEDIAFEAMGVRDEERLAALVNVLLMAPSERTLVFVRTRADTADLAGALSANGFSASALSGEMSQRERTAALAAFRAGTISIVVATDVAARGLDIPDVTRVIHFTLPENADALTHRSGRTGRAGNKGTSIMLMTARERSRGDFLCRRANVSLRWRAVPTPSEITALQDARMRDEIEAAVDTVDERAPELAVLADELLAAHDPRAVVRVLLERLRGAGPCEPREVAQMRIGPSDDAHRHRHHPEPRRGADRARPAPRGPGPEWVRPASRGQESERGEPRPERRDDRGGKTYSLFHLNWGARNGATASRVLAMICRRGDVRSDDIGAIRIGQQSSTVEVSAQSADRFAEAASRPDPKNPNVRVRPWR